MPNADDIRSLASDSNCSSTPRRIRKPGEIFGAEWTNGSAIHEPGALASAAGEAERERMAAIIERNKR